MKKTLKKLLVCILICLMINNFLISGVSFAADDDAFGDWLEGMLGTVVGLLTWPIRLVALGCGVAMDTLTKHVAYSQGGIGSDGSIVDAEDVMSDMITPFDIFFNKIALLDVNFFNILNDGTIISNIRNSIAGWYYVMRMIAAAILLCVLIYVGIRMAISTIASDKAAYKKMLVDWVCSLALIFLLQYIILFTFSVNETFIKALQGIDDGSELRNAMTTIKTTSMGVSVNAIAATIVYCMLVAQTLGLVISYFNRMLKIAFLIIIAPLITLTYSIDKMGDGKAQALGTWLKEFVYTVLIQTFHCIIYMSLVSMAFSIFDGSEKNNLAGAVLAVLCVKFTKDAEKILGKIFNFSGSTSDTSLAVGMAASAMALSKAKSIGKGTRTAINGVRNLNIGGQIRNAKVTAIAMKAAMFGGKDENGQKIQMDSKEQAVDYANARVAEKEAARAEKKNNKGNTKYRVDSKSTEYQKELNERADKLEKETGMTKRLAKATVRKEMAEEARTKQNKAKSDAFFGKNKVLSGARGFVGKVGSAYSIYKESETAKFLKDMGQATLSAGIGTFAGSATYGATGNAFNSIALGMASYKGSQEFLKSSTGTLVDNASKLLQGMGATTKMQAENEMKTIHAMAPILGDNAELQRQLDDLLKFVDDALGKDTNEARTAKSTIRNTVAKNLKEHPEMSNTDLRSKIVDDLNKNGNLSADKTNKLTTSSNFESNCASFALMNRRKELFDTMQNASNLGLNADTFTNITKRHFKENASNSNIRFNSEIDYKTTDEIVSEVKGESGKALSDEDIEKIAGERTEEALGELRQALQEERDELNRKINELEAGDPNLTKLEEEDSKLYETIKEIDNYKEKEIASVLKQYETQYEAARQTLERDLTTMAEAEAKRKFDMEVAKMKQEIDAHKARLEMNFGKERKVPVYDRYFVSTIENLKKSDELES